MSEIIPAILEKNYNEIKNKLGSLRERVGTVHLDFCDGVYVPSQTWPFASGGADDHDFHKILNEEEGLPYWEEFDFEFDLMVADAVENFDIYMKLGPKRMILHLSAQKDIVEFEHFLESLDMYTRDNTQIGLAFKPHDDLEVVKKLSGKVDFLHLMGSDKVGFQGEQFSEQALENIKILKQELPGVIISVDIGINLENAPDILDAGAERLCIGSSIWKNGDPLGALQDFQELTK